MSQIDYTRLSVMRDLDVARRSLIDAGLSNDDASAALAVTIARLPADPFTLGGIAVYFSELNEEVRSLSAEERAARLFREFGSDALRAASVLCRRFSLTPEAVSA